MHKPITTLFTTLLLSLLLFSQACQRSQPADEGPRRIEILFLGHASEHHHSAAYAPMLAAALSQKGININYTEDPNDLNSENLSKYDGLLIYANHDVITPSQEEALLSFVEEGKGFIPVHSASFCFRNSPEYVALVGAQFQKHETGTFTANIVQASHPAVEGLQEFSTWDETYVHHLHTDDRTILMERMEGEEREPWTWVKEYGQGKVFYTAYGHDERTWSQPAFHELMEKGILWAVNDKVKEQWQEYMADMPQLTYKASANIPNYEKRDPWPQLQQPLSPEESKKLIQLPPGFRLELFASEPDIINPIAMDWDERGRLWVIETVDYPNTVRNQEGTGDDRIKILEDTDGDNKADKVTVFAEGLNIPTGLVFANGGIIVSQAPKFIFLKDTDGDDKADIKQEIINGWGTFDTHAGPSNITYGIDNQIWGTVGYSGFEGRVAGKDFKFGQGLYRFTPDLSHFEYLTRTSNNTWGIGFSEEFDVFASTANNTHSVYLGIPNRYFDQARGLEDGGSIKIDGHYAMHPATPNVRQVDVFGGFTAASGHHFYTARSFPQEYWNRIAFVAEPTGHLLHTAIIEPDGAGFKEKDGWNLLASADEWVSPVEAKVGPDGAVWVLDWYNFIIQHNPTPSPNRGGYQAENGPGNAHINPLRDRSHGRIWRVVHEEAPEYEPMTLSMEEPEALVEALAHENMHWRMTAQRLLVERGETDVAPMLYEMVSDTRRDEVGNSPAAVHALWTLHGLGMMDGSDEEAYRIAVKALHHPAPAVRKAALQVLPATPWARQAIIKSDIVNDEDLHTRKAAILALADMPASNKLGAMLYQMSQEEAVQQDEWLSKAVYLASTRHAQGFMEAFMEENPDYTAVSEEEQDLSNVQTAAFDDARWESLQLPAIIEKVGLNLDGRIWFRRSVDIPASLAGQTAVIHLGEINDKDETWVNGKKVGSINQFDSARVYPLPAGTLKAGSNTIAIMMEDFQNEGGFRSPASAMYLLVGNERIPLAGDWKYKVAEVFNRRGNVFEETTVADLLMKNYWQAEPEAAVASAASSDAQQVVIRTIKNDMKYDISEFTVEAGKEVTITFENPDFMQHNLLILATGSLEKVGKAADAMASESGAAEKNYVPDMPEVLFNTPLVNPEQTVTLSFTAPAEPGEYPFVCTFPGHWRIMQGVMKVVGPEAI
jgi:putative membrane-bound dehydrogenase-like protein